MRTLLSMLTRNPRELFTWLLVLGLLFLAMLLLAYVLGMVTLQRLAPAFDSLGYAVLTGSGELVLAGSLAVGLVLLLRKTRSRK